MSYDTEELDARLALCWEDFDALSDRMREFSATGVRTWVVGSPQRGSAYAELLQAYPLRIRVDAGKLANELRAILDALANTLAVRNGDHSFKYYFPICTTEKAWKQDGLKKISGLSDADKERIRIYQPFIVDGDFDYAYALSALHEVDILRKHRLLFGVSGHAGLGAYGTGRIGHIGRGDEKLLERVGDSCCIGHFSGVTAGLGYEFQPVYLQPPSLHGWRVRDALDTFIRLVETIVHGFRTQS